MESHRRSRVRRFSAVARYVLWPDKRATRKATRMTSNNHDKRFYASLNQYSPEQLSSMEAASKASAAAASSMLAAAATTHRQAAQAVTHVTTQIPVVMTPAVAASSTSNAVNSNGDGKTLSTVPLSNVAPQAPSASSLSSAISNSTPVRDISNVVSSAAPSTPAREHTSSSVITSSTITGTSAALSKSSDRSTLATGAVIGIVFAVVVGIVVIGSFFGWLYRKYNARSYNKKAPWSKIDDDITPFNHEKPGYTDVYGNTAAPVMASGRGHSDMPRQYTMYDTASNHAGVGAGGSDPLCNPFDPAPPSALAYTSGVDPQSGHVSAESPLSHMYDTQYAHSHQAEPYSPYPYEVYSAGSDNTRQLVGPVSHSNENGQFVNMPSPVPLGRPAQPNESDLRDLNLYGDDPQMAGLAISRDSPSVETFAQAQQTVSATKPLRYDPSGSANRASQTFDPLVPSDFSRAVKSPIDPTPLPSLPMPTLEPMSPFTSTFELSNSNNRPLDMYVNENAEQEEMLLKQMYGEVAKSAGIDEPKTPYTPRMKASESTSGNALSHSSPMSFATSAVPRLPDLALHPPKPYQHGQPLSPLSEVPTPKSSSETGNALLNPFENPALTIPQAAHTRAAPSTPIGTPSSTGATTYSPNVNGGFNSIVPPNSPGNVPSSVNWSPRRWEGDSVYGGI
ncbi:hypothetical protein L204_103523 [Cryptococcus depauperatus]|nr:hypothetical protein L204_01839 [Cryptococcus depauperatus CBS 7855]